MQELTRHKDKVNLYENLEREVEDVATLWELALEEEDASLEDEIGKAVKKLQKQIESWNWKYFKQSCRSIMQLLLCILGLAN